jgi:hypothetical protein
MTNGVLDVTREIEGRTDSVDGDARVAHIVDEELHVEIGTLSVFGGPSGSL